MQILGDGGKSCGDNKHACRGASTGARGGNGGRKLWMACLFNARRVLQFERVDCMTYCS